jgi:hypothetical protein
LSQDSERSDLIHDCDRNGFRLLKINQRSGICRRVHLRNLPVITQLKCFRNVDAPNVWLYDNGYDPQTSRALFIEGKAAAQTLLAILQPVFLYIPIQNDSVQSNPYGRWKEPNSAGAVESREKPDADVSLGQ